MPLSTEPYKGTRDFYPEDKFIQNYIFGIMRKVSESYGYLEYDASILEDSALYKAKSGDEIVNEQTYTFKDRGDREVTLRPEMTPTVARLVAGKRKELAFPLRWYSIPNLFRYERPQRGRLREHWQLNVDLFGVESASADEEIVLIARDIMKAYGAHDENFKIRINNRKFMNYLFNEYLKLSENVAHTLAKLIDRKDKTEEEKFYEELKELIGEDRTESFLEILNVDSIDMLPQDMRGLSSIHELQSVFQDLIKRGIENTVFDPTLMRGFDYYTGIVFEVFDTNPVNSRSLFGGGRYDDLVALFGVEKVSGVGFGMGDVTIRDYLETYSLLPEYKSSANLYLCVMGQKYQYYAQALAAKLRLQGVNVAIDYTDRPIGSQVKTADRHNVQFVLCIGENEIQSKVFRLKDMKLKSEESIQEPDLLRRLASI